MKLILSILALTLAVVSSAAAQTPTATLVGRITDPTHAVIPGATIIVRDLNTNSLRTAKTDKQGEYTLSDLAPDDYEVTVSMDKFKEAYEPTITLQAGQTARFDVGLQVGSVKDEVTVTTAVGLLNTETSDKGDVISPVEISEMPLNGRDFNDLVFNVAGIAPSEEGSKGSEFVAGGTRSDSTNITVDGINNTNPRDSTAEATPPLDSLQEFKVSTSNYSAEYGRVAGPVVNLVIKKGGNVLHGSVFEFVRNDLFDAGNYFDVKGTRSELRRNQFGATLGGPVYIPHVYNGHNKTFFLISTESYRQVQGSNSISIVPTALERSGDFSQSYNSFTGQAFSATPATQLYDPATLQVLPNYKLPSSSFDPIAVQLTNQFYPMPTPNVTLPGTNNFIVNQKAYSYWDNVVAKIDQQLAAHDEASIKYLFRHEHTTKPFSGAETGLFGAIDHNLQTIIGFNETHIFTSNLINDFRSGLTRNVSDERPFDHGTDWAALIGMQGTTSDPNLEQFPSFSPTGYAGIGDSTQEPVVYTTNNYDTNDTVTWNHGKHTVKFGGSMLREQYFQATNSEFSGALGFSAKKTCVIGTKATSTCPGPTAGAPAGTTVSAQNGYLQFLAGYNTSADLRQGTVSNHLFDANYGAFAQDDYKVLAGLTLNLGMRYELETLPYELNNQFSNFLPNVIGPTGYLGVAVLAAQETATLDAALNATTTTKTCTACYTTYAANIGYPRRLVYPNLNRLAPRFGFAWRPTLNDQLVIRGGYGIYYTGSRLSVIRTELSGQFPYSILQSCGAASLNGPGLASAFLPANCNGRFSSINGYDPHAASSYVQQFNFTMERELPKGLAMELAYSGSKGTHLGRQIDINQGDPALGPPTISQSSGGYVFPRPYPGPAVVPSGFASINWFNFQAYSNYNAGTATLRKRFEHGLLFRINFTYARYLDTSSGLNYAGKGGYNGAQYTHNPNAEYGRDDSDRKFVLNGNYVYMLPFHRNFYVSGWELAGSVQVDSGQPLTPQLNGPNQSDGVPTRPNRVCNGALAHPSVNLWFNTSCFVQIPPPYGTFGNSGRNILTGPKLVVINASLSRNFRITDKQKLQFRWEVFNVPNHPNFNLPNDNIDESNVGTITQAHDPRVMQLGGKYTF